MNKYRISIITPVFNGQRFIESCINNVIEQKCPEAEHIIVDGGSTDNTAGIIKKYADRFSHIRWISEKDKGQSDAMNKGISIAKGEILGFLNVDDYYEPNVLNRVLEIFRVMPEPSLVVGNCNMRNDDYRILAVNKPSNLKFADLLIGEDSISPFPINPSAYFYHRSLHDKIGFYNNDEHYTLDFEFLLRAIPSATVTYRDETWGNYLLYRGTKTYEDIKDGLADTRFHNLLKSYRKQLPLFIQLKIIMIAHAYNCFHKTKHLLKKLLIAKHLIKNPNRF